MILINIFLVTDVLSSLFNDNQIAEIPMSECKICFKVLSVEPLLCCSSSICSKCVYHYFTTNINETRIRITCPSCPHIFTRKEILSLLSNYDHNGNISERYKRFYADINREAHIKTCPRCCSIKQIDKRLFEGIRWKKNDSTKSSHESRFSPLGCKYNFYPDKPLVRHTVRGLVAGAASLAIPVAAVGAVALLAVGTTIGAPTYGTYRLVKHIHSKRQERRQRYRTKTIARHWNTSDSLSTDDQMIESDDIRRTVQAIA
ncbi:unnamed protein product [Rotaria socialis]|uniref:RING-type domain-containing protein n=1 Tax=Rotaria socialis TaxID=392032 RepID=A0A820EGH5_9BILA|nr:unnamed protein product [Rotaria socialis]CAF4357530.1 unnamed protein product [Rotaria socialis]CAF4640316.1 unnamed protein product [Rotaria socialis]CAF4667766.1 unnamed protein product [Rotaria socialis]